MAIKYRLTIEGDTADADALSAAVAKFVETLELASTATAALEFETSGKPTEAIDVAREPVTIQLDLTDKGAPVIVSVRDGKYRGVGVSVATATADLEKVIVSPENIATILELAEK